MEPRAWFVSATVVILMGVLATNRIAVDIAMMGGLALLLLGDVLWGGILSIPDAMSGFANPALLLIAALFVVAAGLEKTGAIEKVARLLFGSPKTEVETQMRLTVPVAIMSGAMNNTPIVAMYLGVVQDWARRLKISPSKLYMPLSFAAILGGKLTLFGTASNMVVLGLYRAHVSRLPESEQAHYLLSQLREFWGIALLGGPTTVVGLALMIFGSRWLIPNRRKTGEDSDDVRPFHVEMCVADNAPIDGMTIQEAGLRHLPGLFLAHIERGDETYVAERNLRLRSGDHLAFVGALDSVRDLRKIRGLVPVETDRSEPESAFDTVLVEAVVSARSSLVGGTVKDASFRAKYHAAIWAVHRHGEQLQGKIGDIRLRAGDTLLLEVRSSETSVLRQSPDFYLTSPVRESSAIRHDRANVALAVFVLMIFIITVMGVTAPAAALFGATLMVVTGCVGHNVARSVINWQVLTVIGAALGVGRALQNTGVAESLANTVVAALAGAPVSLVVFVLFLLTAGFAQLITNNGAAVIMFPIFMLVAERYGVHPHALLFTLMVAAGSTFLSPISYQTNLMVYGPGGYKFLDFARLGVPLTLLLAVTCAVLAPILY